MTDSADDLDGLEMFTAGYPPPLTNYNTEPVNPITTIAAAFADLNRAITTHQPPDHHRKTPPMTTNHSITQTVTEISDALAHAGQLRVWFQTNRGEYSCQVCGATHTVNPATGLNGLTAFQRWISHHRSRAHADAHALAAAIRDRATPVTCALCGVTRHLNPATATITDLIEYERWSGAHNCLAHWGSLIVLHGRKWECRDGHSYKVPKRPTVAQIKAWRDWCIDHRHVHSDPAPVEPQ